MYITVCFDLSCDSTTMNLQEHLATCTNFIVRDNVYYGESPFCPYPPSVSVTKQFPRPNQSDPLDLMSYFVDERLMEMAEDEDPVQFFREYMAGFIISRRESAVSHCGVNTSTSLDNGIDINDLDNGIDINDLMCTMLSTSSLVQNDQFLFTDSMARQSIMDSTSQCYNRYHDVVLTYLDTISCSVHVDVIANYENLDTPHTQYPICNNVIRELNSTTLSFEQNTTNFMSIDNDFEVDGTIRQTTDFINIEGDPLVGRLYAPYNNDIEVGVTVYYNNQV